MCRFHKWKEITSQHRVCLKCGRMERLYFDSEPYGYMAWRIWENSFDDFKKDILKFQELPKDPFNLQDEQKRALTYITSSNVTDEKEKQK
jgi:hypothetical protein